MKSSLKNMVIVLTTVTLISSAAVGGVYIMTKEPIEIANKLKFTNAIGNVLPAFDTLKNVVIVKSANGGSDMKVYEAIKDNKTVGYAVETAELGFTQDIILLAGFNASGEIHKIAVLSHAETPGLGAKITNPEEKFVVQYQGKDPKTFDLRVKKDGGDVDAITASTITSKAYSAAVLNAYEAIKSLQNKEK